MTATEAEAVTAGLFPAYVANLNAKCTEDGDAFTRQFQALVKESSKLAGTTEGSSNIALLPENIAKNRSKDAVPFDYNLVKLEPRVGAEGDYINASLIKGPSASETYIATQSPLPETVADFWRMVIQVKASVIVNVTCPPKDDNDSFVKYWDMQDSVLQPVGLDVKMHNELSRDYFVLRTLVLKDDQTGSLDWVYQLDLSEWPKDISDPACVGLAELLKFICHYQKASAGPLVVHGRRGCGRVGTIIALYNTRRELDSNGKAAAMDVYSTVASLLQQRMKMIETQDQYRFLNFFLAQMIEGEFGSQPAQSLSNDTGNEPAVENKAAEPDQVAEEIGEQRRVAEISKEMENSKDDDDHEAPSTESTSERSEPSETAQIMGAELAKEAVKETGQVPEIGGQAQQTKEDGENILNNKSEARVGSPVVAELNKAGEEGSIEDQEEMTRKLAENEGERERKAMRAQERQSLEKEALPKPANESTTRQAMDEVAAKIEEDVPHANVETRENEEKSVADEMTALPAKESGGAESKKEDIDLDVGKAGQCKVEAFDGEVVGQAPTEKEATETASKEGVATSAEACQGQAGDSAEEKQDQVVKEEEVLSTAEKDVLALESAASQDNAKAQPSEPAPATTTEANGERPLEEAATKATADVDVKKPDGQLAPMAAQEGIDGGVTPATTETSANLTTDASNEKVDGADEGKEAGEKASGHDRKMSATTKSKGKSAGSKVKRTSVGVLRNLTMLGGSAKKSASTTFLRKKSVAESEPASELSSQAAPESAKKISRSETVPPSKKENDSKRTSYDASEAPHDTHAKPSGSTFMSRFKSGSKPKIDVPKAEMHKVEMPKLDMPKLDKPKLNMRRISSSHAPTIDWISAYNAREANNEANQQRPEWPILSDFDAFGPYHRYQVPVGPRPSPWTEA